MAGYVLKIVVENTHPPVWRRVMVPGKITFEDLHKIIQILFDWEGYHMHSFQIPSDNIFIEQDTGEDSFWDYEGYKETETLIDPFFRKYKWVRYTYDFGDDWRHKIIIEKIDEDYQERDVILMKYKGDNFMEDSGGVWSDDESSRFAFEPEQTKARLENMCPLPVRDLEEPELPVNYREQMEKMYEKFQKMLSESGRSDFLKDDSLMEEKIDEWQEFCEIGEKEPLEFAESLHSQSELLQALSELEATDYCKYLQIPVKVSDSKDDKISAIAQTLQSHPEYLFYTFAEDEYDTLCKLTKSHLEELAKSDCGEDAVTRLIGIGLGNFQNDGRKGVLSFAPEWNTLLNQITPKLKKDTYRKINKFNERMLALLQVYGMADLESLYKIYCSLYDKNQDKTEFFRLVYWYGSFNCIFDTSYTDDGRSFASMSEIDSQEVLMKLEKFGKGLEYASFSREELRHRAANLANRSDWINALVEILHYQAKLSIEEAQECMMAVVIGTLNGNTLEEAFSIVSDWYKLGHDIIADAEIWTAISGIMLELELPMLKGRNRIQYAEEKRMSPWMVDMTEHSSLESPGKVMHMYDFPESVQDMMYTADCFGHSDALDALWDYKKQNKIRSEEFLYLLCSACITWEKTEEAETLLKELEKGTAAGQDAARLLRNRLQERYNVVDDEFEDDDLIYPWNDTKPPTPFVRQSPKIGRNDPCPCGSGKKYKKCCGK